ncbi:hypothetical protein TSH58p_17515 [Azospirillum sp. TSH58]|uniref:DEAD/DEAH box helicase n=1 Tax=Azospirillum sp. TSH58 TaxID=664962 RepID=UPI000D60284D|nr:DEAD/DEAH box helicase family protein [Azospirillum sp. TSH58]AWJ85163.1 hypothetical protein TSH58p_17515 [Azospirillum sp. TSH58]
MKLRPYQQKNADEILACLARGVRGTLYALPTAGGKTATVVRGVIREVVNLGWPTVFLVHRRELLHQAVRTLARVGIQASVVDQDHDLDPLALVHVCSIDTLKARKKRLAGWLLTIKLVVVDEAHHAVAAGWQALLEDFTNALILGVTATPYRGDGKPLGVLFNEAVRGPSVAELTPRWLCPAEVWEPWSPDTSGVPISRGDFAVGELDRLMNNDKITKMAMNAYAARMPGEPAIVFCVSIAHARRAAAISAAYGWRAIAVDGEMSDTDRDSAIDGLASGYYQHLMSCQLVNEGTDIPVVSGAINLRPTKSTQLKKQQDGRVLRTHFGKTRSCIIDMAGGANLHGLPDADLLWTLEDGLIPIRHRTIRCPKCHRRFEPGPFCPSCSMAFPHWRQTTLPVLAGVSEHILRKLPTQELERFVASEIDIRHIARAKGLANSWIYHASQRLRERQNERRRA